METLIDKIVEHTPTGSLGLVRRYAFSTDNAVQVNITKVLSGSHHKVGDSHTWLEADLQIN